MADIDFYQDDPEDTSEDTYGLDDGVCSDESMSDDNLSPLQKLKKYMDSDNAFSRQLVARGILDTLRTVGDSEEDCRSVLKAMVKLSEDVEPVVRSDLVEQVPHVAMYCQENRHLFDNSVANYILPLIVGYLSDADNQVRKTSHAALVVLLEQELVDKVDVEEQVVNIILDLASPSSPDEFRTEAAALMSKMAPLLGREMTERLFISRFCQMCSDPLFHVRRICAVNFGEICNVVGSETTQQLLLSKFSFLCDDGVWNVRKSCAESFMTVASLCSVEARRNELTNLFVQLLCDRSRWVRVAAFQQLGPFISTFSNPNTSGFFVDDEGMLCIYHEDPMELGYSPLEPELKSEGAPLVKTENDHQVMHKGSTLPQESTNCDSKQTSGCDTPSLPPHSASPCDDGLDIICDDEVVNDLNDTSMALLYMGEISMEEKRVQVYYQRHHETQTSVGNSVALVAKQGLTSLVQSQQAPDIAGDAIVAGQDLGSGETQLVEAPGEHMHIHMDNVKLFNSFEFWRTPLPVLELELDLVHNKTTNSYITTKIKENAQQKIYPTQVDATVASVEDSGDLPFSATSESQVDLRSSANTTIMDSLQVEAGDVRIHTASVGTVSAASETVSNIGSTYVLCKLLDETSLIGGSMDSDYKSINYSDISCRLQKHSESSITDQDSQVVRPDTLICQQQGIVPPSLLENFLSMVNPVIAQTVDMEITRHCAYNFPAVAFTLGRSNWHCLRKLYEALAADLQWKVRRTLAFSIHELAVVLGDEITHDDLVPVFNGFLKDLDEVRIGVLKHLMDFLRLLKSDVQQEYLPKIQCFLNSECQRNWRFRLELARQCDYICKLFRGEDISNHLVPIGLTLLADRVAEVRITTYNLISTMLRRLHNPSDEQLYLRLANDLLEKFALCSKWGGRQIFAQLCWTVLEDNSIPPERFAKDFLPSLLSLATDSIPNVRISLAKTLSQCILPVDYFVSHQNPHHEDLVRAMLALQGDADRDVRYFASPPQQSYQGDSQDGSDSHDTNSRVTNVQMNSQASWSSLPA